MPATTTLFLLQDLHGGSRTAQLAESDLGALQAVAGSVRSPTPEEVIAPAQTNYRRSS
jgi:hypothetical protein